MKKKLLIIVGVLVLLVGGVFGYLAINASGIAARFKPEIEKFASQALGNEVALGDMQVSIFPSVNLVSYGLRVGKSDSADLKLERLVFSLGLSKLLTGKVDVSELKLIAPEVVIRKNAEGLSLAGLKSKTKTPSTGSGTPTEVGTHPPGSSSRLPSWLSLNLDTFSLERGAVNFVDQAANRTILINEIEIESGVKVLSPNISLPAVNFSALIQKALNVSVEAKEINYNLDNGELKLPDAALSMLDGTLGLKGQYNINSSSADFDISTKKSLSLTKLSSLSSLVPALAQAALVGGVAPTLNAKLVEGVTTAAGKVALEGIGLSKEGLNLSELNGTMELKIALPSMQAKSSDLTLKLNEQPIRAQFVGELNQELKLNPLTLQLAGGEIKDNLRLVPASGEFSTSFELLTLQIAQLLQIAKPEMAQKLSGVLHRVSGKLSGSLGSNLMQSLQGDVAVDVRDSFIPGVNLAAKVLSAVKDLPFLSGALISAVPPQLRNELNSESTVIKSLVGNFRIANAALTTSDLNIVSNIFSLTGSGRVGFDSSVDLNATIFFSRAFSEELVIKVKELKNILDKDGRLVIPLKISGSGSSVAVLPDLGKLLQLGAQNALKDHASDLLNKALGGKSKSKGGGLGGLLGF